MAGSAIVNGDIAGEARRWFDSVLAQIDTRKAAGAASHSCTWQIGPLSLHQRWFGDARFERLHGPLAHLPPAHHGTGLVIDCLGGSDGVSLGLSPFRKRDLGPCRSIPALAATSLRVLWDHDHGFVQALDIVAGRGFFYAEDFDRLPPWEPAIPFRSFIHWWAAVAGCLFVHGGSVGTEACGLVLLGNSGTGKSTTTLAAVAAGLKTCGDDYVLVTPGPAPRVHSVFGTAKLKDGSALAAGLVPEHCLAQSARVDDKLILTPALAMPGSFVPSFPLRGLAILSFADGDQTVIEPASAAAAVRAAAPSTVLQMPYDQTTVLARIGELARDVPCYNLRLGRDLAALGQTLRAFLAGLSKARAA
ncbi:MAG: hypothetical protein KIT16_08430 [Rhodospirillaceae bacterium]|nr:hypothetical protein [Rhodospirillaceae bacterium]